MPTRKKPAARRKPAPRKKGKHVRRDQRVVMPAEWSPVPPAMFYNLRRKYQLSIELAARIIGVSFSTWWRWENGHQKSLGYKYRAAVKMVEEWGEKNGRLPTILGSEKRPLEFRPL